jgi:hypothetical protein
MEEFSTPFPDLFLDITDGVSDYPDVVEQHEQHQHA